MFDNCTTLLDLNKARLDAIRDDRDNLAEINKEYQRVRKLIVEAQPKYMKLKARRPNVTQNPLVVGIPYAGPCDEELTLKYTKKGFVC